MEKKTKKTYDRTVAAELLEMWQKSRRKKDPDTIAEALGYSRPVIDRALLYGYVSMPELPGLITKFFTDRIQKEIAMSQELKQLTDLQKP